MRECRFKKRMQIYLDGWMDDKEARRFEKHLKRCSDCQTEMVELGEVASAALEIVDQAPDIDYWRNFPARVLNRIISRDVSPYEGKQRSARSLRLKIGSYSVAITALAAAALFILNYVDRSLVVPDTGSQEGIEIPGPTMTRDPVEPMIFTAAESEEPSATDESESILSGQLNVRAEDKPLVTVERSYGVEQEMPQPSRVPSVAQSVNDFEMVLRKPTSFDGPSLKLDDDYNFLNRLMAAYRGKAADDYRISQAVVARGILSGYTSRNVDRLDNGNYGSPDIGPASSLAGGGYSLRWGYLNLPDDTSNTEELRKYVIELELMQAK
jgi:hypothetical protein